MSDKRSRIIAAANPNSHAERVKRELTDLGLNKYELWSAESRYLPHIIHPDEHLGGVVVGYKEGALMMLVATDRRVIMLDKKPLFVNEDEIAYDMVGGVRFTHAGLGSTVTLHTRIKDYPIVTFNKHAAENFVAYIEARSLEYMKAPAGPPPPKFNEVFRRPSLFG